MRFGILLILLGICPQCFAKIICDTVSTPQNDKIILTYNLTSDDNSIRIDVTDTRVIPSKNYSAGSLMKVCNGEPGRLKVVCFDRIGESRTIKWSGKKAVAFMTPAGFSCDRSPDGFYLLGQNQSLPITFQGEVNRDMTIELPLFIALYDKKHNYKIVSQSARPLSIKIRKPRSSAASTRPRKSHTETRREAVNSTYEEFDNDNENIVNALNSINYIEELLPRENEFPLSQQLQFEIHNLQSLKNKVSDRTVSERIKQTLLRCAEREQELKESQNSAQMAAKAEEQLIREREKQEAEEKEAAAEAKARLQEEKQQKRTLWMIIGGAILAVLGFIGNVVFKHFRDVRNQRNIMEMQESLARQAQHEAGRRTREIVRNKAHVMANKGRGKLRESVNNIRKPKNKDNKRRTI